MSSERKPEPVGWTDDCGDPDCYGLETVMVGFRRIPEHPVECVCGAIIETWRPLFRHPPHMGATMNRERLEALAERWEDRAKVMQRTSGQDLHPVAGAFKWCAEEIRTAPPSSSTDENQ